MDVLCLDHINGGGLEERKKYGTRLENWLKKRGYPEGYQVLCANCNHRKEMQRRRAKHGDII